MTQRIFVLTFFSFFASCDKRLNEVTVSNGEIQVTRYGRSEISTVHDFIEVSKGNSTITVLEKNSYGFADIIINHDTIIIQNLPTVIYKITDKAFNYKIKLDTTISVDYWRQKVEERKK